MRMTLLFSLSVNTLLDISSSNRAVLKLITDDIMLYKSVRCEEDLVEMAL